MTSGTAAKETFAVFGTTATLLVTDPAALSQARVIADAELAAVDQACSRFRPDSEISRLNGAHSRLTPVSPLFAELIAAALRAAELTDGAVDPTCGQALVAAGYDRDFSELRSSHDDRPSPDGRPSQAGRPSQDDRPSPAGRPGPDDSTGTAGTAVSAGPIPGWRGVLLDRDRRLARLDDGVRLDLGATAKAWAADRCADLIAARLRCGVLISLGGDIAAAGRVPDDGWHVKVTDDHADDDASGQVVTIRSGGLATSSTTVRTWTAGGQRRHHIIDPSTGEPAMSCWRTVSVAAGTCVDANIASTAAIIASEAALSWLGEAGLPARLVRTDGSVLRTAGWPAPA
jgi:thiamine biosynthesis lipoprotein